MGSLREWLARVLLGDQPNTATAEREPALSSDVAKLDRLAAQVERQACALAGVSVRALEASALDDPASAASERLRSALSALGEVRSAPNVEAAGDPPEPLSTGEAPPASEEIFEGVPPVVERTIRFRDTIGSLVVDDEEDRRFYGWLDREIVRILELLEVTVIDDNGGDPVDDRRHEIIDVTSPADGATVGTIAETVRAGYRYHDLLVRPQEIIAFEEGTT